MNAQSLVAKVWNFAHVPRVFGIVFGLLALGGPAALAEEMSGTYLGKGSNSAFLVQIVETSDGHLTGRYEQIVLQPAGKIDDMNANIAGAANGQTVVVTITPAEALSSNIVASGTIEGRTLHLTGGGNGANLNLNLLKSDEADFRMQVAALTEQGRQMNEARARQEAAQRQAKATADQLANLQNLIERMSVFTTKADTLLPKFAPAAQRYRDITQGMRGALSREQSIYGGGQASVARGQISVAINQAAIQGDQFHISVQSSYREFASNADQLVRESASANQSCRGAHEVTDTAPAPMGHEAENAACLHFFDVAKKFQQTGSKLGAAFAQIEAVWNTERRAQDEIVRISDVAVQ